MTTSFCIPFRKLQRNWLNFLRRCKRIVRLMSSSRKYFSKILSRVKTNFWMKQWIIYRTEFYNLNSGLKWFKDLIENWLLTYKLRPMSWVLSKKQCFTALKKINKMFILKSFHRLWKSSELNRCSMRVQSMRLKSKRISVLIGVNTSSCKTKQGSMTVSTKTSTNQSPKRAQSQNPSQLTREERQGKQMMNQTHSG